MVQHAVVAMNLDPLPVVLPQMDSLCPSAGLVRGVPESGIGAAHAEYTHSPRPEGICEYG